MPCQELTPDQTAHLRWIDASRINRGEWLGEDGADGFHLSGPDGLITIPLADHIALRPYFQTNLDMKPRPDCRMYCLTARGVLALYKSEKAA